MSISNEQEEQLVAPTAFLEPKIISQPILYSIANTRTSPIDEQSKSIDKQLRSSTIHTISDQTRRSTLDTTTNSLNVSTQTIDQSLAFHSLTSTPYVQGQLQQTSKQKLQSPSNIYSVASSSAHTSRGVQVRMPEPVQPAPILYTIVGDTPASTNGLTKNDLSTSTTTKSQPPTVPISSLDDEANILQTRKQQPTLYSLVRKASSPVQNSAR